MNLTPEQLRRAVDAYDAERCRQHGLPLDQAGMSERNKESITPMIAAAIRAALSNPNA